MRETSLKAYFTLPNLGGMQAEVYRAIGDYFNKKGQYPTDRELADEMGYGDPNKVRPRRNELMEAGFVVEGGKRKCSITGRKALTWKVLII